MLIGIDEEKRSLNEVLMAPLDAALQHGMAPGFAEHSENLCWSDIQELFSVLCVETHLRKCSL